MTFTISQTTIIFLLLVTGTDNYNNNYIDNFA